MMMMMGGGAAPAFVGALDAYTTSMVHLYDPARRWLTAYTGNLVRLRRASDDAESDFTYTATGELDLAAIATWAGGASCVVTVYDQKGSDNVTQAVAANQPLFTASAQNGHAGMTFDGSNDYLQGAYTNGGALSQPFSVYAVAQLNAAAVDDGATRTVFSADDTTNRAEFSTRTQTTPDSWMIYAGLGAVIGNATNANWNLVSALFNAGAGGQFWINGISEALGSPGPQNPDGMTIGALGGSTNCWKGLITSVIVVDPAHSDADRISFQNAINSYWSLFF